MLVLQLLILSLLIINIIINCINFMDSYSKESIGNFKSERNWKVLITIIVFILLYFAGTFNLIL